jgi:MerR family transcriptional regulator, light-induced transcriptional regulator
VLVPKRTSTNIRYCDDDQLRHLLNIVTLLDAGHKISEIAAIPHRLVEETILAHAHADAVGKLGQERLANELILSSLRFDRGDFEVKPYRPRTSFLPAF